MAKWLKKGLKKERFSTAAPIGQSVISLLGINQPVRVVLPANHRWSSKKEGRLSVLIKNAITKSQLNNNRKSTKIKWKWAAVAEWQTQWTQNPSIARS